MAKDNMEDYKKKYEDIIEKVKNLLNKSKDIGVNIIRIQDIEDTIPEIKESKDEDERIKKIIKNTLQSYNRGIVLGCLNAKDYSDCLAWLEKQSETFTKKDIDDDYELVEQKTNDKVEPKSKVEKGKWYVCTNTFVSKGKLIAIKGQTYQSKQEDDTITCENNCLFIDRHDGKASDYFRLWTIKDAKDGDVLVYYNEISIYKDIIKACTENDTKFGGFTYYCCYDSNLRLNSFYSLTSKDEENIHPATKEQRDQLEKVMADAGYAFDFEKKELKKIAQKPAIKLERDENGEPILTPFEAGLFSMMSVAWQGYSLGQEVNLAKIVKEHSIELLERANEQKPTEWSEKDERMFKNTIALIETLEDYNKAPDGFGDVKFWLKSLKDRVGCEVNCTTTKDWSKEDERIYQSIIDDTVQENQLNDKQTKWLKGIKYRYFPQPKQEWSEEDENHVKSILSTIECCKAQFPNAQSVVEAYNADIEWFKSLKDRYTWKPSDLPHWKKNNLQNDNTTGFNSDYFCHNGYYINYKELFEKLPKDD